MSLTAAGLITAFIITLGYGVRALSASGAATALVVGVLVLHGSGAPGLWALGAFFVTSSVLSRLTVRHEPGWFDAPGHRRNAVQVAANGGVAAIGGVFALAGRPELGIGIIVSSLAAAAADTWATSIGMTSTKDPVDISRWTRIPKGASGGISPRGTLGGVAGATTVGLAALLGGAPAALVPVATTAGVLGMLLDSLLGARLQGRFHCDRCDLPSERPVHRCGTPTRRTSGLRHLGNDGVNAIANALAGAAGATWWALR
jgi:uncharacterized protein (TIGR00297 family)